MNLQIIMMVASVNMNRIVKVGYGLELTYLASERRERDT